MQNEFDRSEFDPAADPLDELLRSAQWPDDGTDPLDRLLRMAAWPEPAAGPLRHGLKKRSWVWAIGSIAAAAVFVISLTAWSMRGSGRSSSEGVATTVGRDAIPRPAASDDVAADRDSPPTHEQKTSPKTEGSRETVLAINSPVLSEHYHRENCIGECFGLEFGPPQCRTTEIGLPNCWHNELPTPPAILRNESNHWCTTGQSASGVSWNAFTRLPVSGNRLPSSC